MFKNLTIKMKLISSFSLMVILIAGLAIYSISSINETSNGFSKYRKIAKQSILASDLHSNMLMVRMHVLDYFKVATQKSMDGFNKYYDISEGLVSEALTEIKDPSRVSMVEEINKSFDTYKKGFLNVVTLIKEKNDEVLNNLEVNGKKINRSLNSIIKSTKDDKKESVTSLAGKAVEASLFARLYSRKFLDSNEKEDYNRVLKELTNFDKVLDDLTTVVEDPKRKEQLQMVSSASKTYKNGINFIYKTINDRNNIIKQLWVLDLRIVELSKNIIISTKKDQDTIGPAVQKLNSNIKSLVTTISIIILVLAIFLAIALPRNIANLLNTFQEGLIDFFKYLNREIGEVERIKIDSTDEFGKMAKVVNENIEKTKKGIEEDRKLIDETIAVLGEFEQGDLVQRLDINVSNPALMQLKDVLNKMADNLENNINNVLNIVEEYSSYNYLNKISTTGLKEHLLKLSSGINALGDSITEMLLESKSNGLTLDKSSNTLLNNVDKLNQSSSEAASSLEETAAALEEITSNIRSNTENIAKMSSLSLGVTEAANNGEALANDTTLAMEEIDSQVTAIKEAITVIDQISFQTNILSLNAAVEAATAGEAGKGFAVVAGEVRNLASRSAEAATEIKSLVENATTKANEGKNIAREMIKGYKVLNDNIGGTAKIISDVESASKEQLSGIEQINDAVNQLDQQTQQNAMVASETQDIATLTDELAKLIVSDANSKEFKGKDSVKAKESNKDDNIKEELKQDAKEPKRQNQAEIKKAQKDTDDWESF
ncbi:methyl-accepting chemotaxis protein [Arcobacter sp. F2176]|uniref:methyl-accepting chemotaxis protein n=1 Tax=Arcobacter sp. F2176 TaxID=2044511 RepID=UPI00100AACBC|nr:methyl-accepting chemotaxis protein [Arcobacter sp. F2176]RXJ78348.1 chemotaxis protein [Arcobacter sp. F2176]